jgi:signal transduction histidine kinase
VKWVERQLREREPELAERLRRALSVLERAVVVERDVIEALRPSLLDTLGLATALEALCEAFTRRTGIEVVPDLDADLRALPPDASIALYRVVEAALADVRERAQAKLVRVAVQRENEQLHLVIEDDGVGSPDDVLAEPRAHGLVGMRERLRMLGGTLVLRRGANGRGTVVDATVPPPGP